MPCMSPGCAPCPLQAAWKGCRVPESLFRTGTARIHSVFARACNLVLPEGALVALLHPELPRTPWGLRLAALPFAFSDHLEPGQPVTFDGHALRVGSITVHLDKARLWDAALPPFLAPQVSAQQAALSVLTPLLPVAPLPATPLTLEERVQAALDAGLSELGAALAAGDDAAVVNAAGRLMGLGPGLTPSGDDMLTGVLAALWTWAPAGGGQPPLAAFPLRDTLAHWVRGAAPRTTHAVAAQFLVQAADGLFAENVRDVILALNTVNIDNGQLAAAAAHLLDFGASSGRDTLAGLCQGLAVLSGTAYTRLNGIAYDFTTRD